MSQPFVTAIHPSRATEGGRVTVIGTGLADALTQPPQVRVQDRLARVVFASSNRVSFIVPSGIAEAGPVLVRLGDRQNESVVIDHAAPVATGLHQVDNPLVDRAGNLYVTYSGTRGQQVPVSIFRIAPNGNMSVYVEGMGVATGIAFDREQNLYVGDRSGTIFKISPSRQIFVFATLEPSISAYHLTFGPDNQLYVTGPTTSSFDAVHRISQDGEVDVFYRGLGRPQGLAFGPDGSLFVVEALAGASGLYRLSDGREPELVLAGPALIGLAFDPRGGLVVCSNETVYRLPSFS